MKQTHTYCVAAFLAAIPGLVGRPSQIVTFESFSPPPAGYLNGSDGAGGFTENGVFFNNAYTAKYDSWSGFAISNVNNPSTGGYMNQYAVAAPGTGDGGSGNYAVLYDSAFEDSATDFIRFSSEITPLSLRLNNTAYAAQAMLNGDAPARKFVAEDWFRLTLSAVNSAGQDTGSLIEVYLADFRDGKTFVQQEWQTVDLSDLGPSVREIRFAFASTDNGEYGMNTPAYAALDNLAFVPEPGTAGLISLGLLLLRTRVRRR